MTIDPQMQINGNCDQKEIMFELKKWESQLKFAAKNVNKFFFLFYYFVFLKLHNLTVKEINLKSSGKIQLQSKIIIK